MVIRFLSLGSDRVMYQMIYTLPVRTVTFVDAQDDVETTYALVHPIHETNDETLLDRSHGGMQVGVGGGIVHAEAGQLLDHVIYIGVSLLSEFQDVYPLPLGTVLLFPGSANKYDAQIEKM